MNTEPHYNIWRAWSVRCKQGVFVVGRFDKETGLYRYLRRKSRISERQLSELTPFYECMQYRIENSARVQATRAYGGSFMADATLNPYDILAGHLIHWSQRPKKKRKKKYKG